MQSTSSFYTTGGYAQPAAYYTAGSAQPAAYYTAGSAPTVAAAPSIPYDMLGGPGDQLSREECLAFGVPVGSSWCSGPGFAPTVGATAYAPAAASYAYAPTGLEDQY